MINRLDEFLRRRVRLQRVEEALRRNIVIGFFDTLYCYRRFRRERQSTHPVDVPPFEVPQIFVGDEEGNESQAVAESTPNLRKPSSITSRAPNLPPLPRIDTSFFPTRGDWGSLSPLSPSRSMFESYEDNQAPSARTSSTHDRSENASVSLNDVMEDLGNSAWGQSIRRSFTVRRSSDS